MPAAELVSEDFNPALLGFPATISYRADRGPVRPITNGRRTHPTGRYYSVKNGRALPWESRNELHGLYHAEVASEVISYWVQPHKLKMVIGSAIQIYTPDREELLADGRRRIVEVKDQFKVEKDPAYTQKLEHAHAIYQLSGKLYRIEERAKIESQPLFAAVDMIQSFRRTSVTPHDLILIYQAFNGQEELPLAMVRDIFKSPTLGFAKICAMTVRRMITLDLTHKFGPETPVRILHRH